MPVIDSEYTFVVEIPHFLIRVWITAHALTTVGMDNHIKSVASAACDFTPDNEILNENMKDLAMKVLNFPDVSAVEIINEGQRRYVSQKNCSIGRVGIVLYKDWKN